MIIKISKAAHSQYSWMYTARTLKGNTFEGLEYNLRLIDSLIEDHEKTLENYKARRDALLAAQGHPE